MFGVGASFTATGFGIRFPTENKTFIHNTIDPMDINKNIPAEHALIGDSKLTLQALIDGGERAPRRQAARPARRRSCRRSRTQKDQWLQQWMPRAHRRTQAPLEPYRVIWDLLHTVDVPNTRDHARRRQPARRAIAVLGDDDAAQLHRLGQDARSSATASGLAMGAKLAQPDKLCMNMWGDAAIGMTGMDFETAVRERIPILSILFNNYSMAMEIPVMKLSHEKYNSTDISGNYADFATALGGYGERVTEPGEIIPAIKRGIEADEERPAGAAGVHHHARRWSTRRSASGTTRQAGPAPMLGSPLRSRRVELAR